MITIEKWQGMVTNASPYAVPGGACVVQTNVQCLKPGQIQGRAGLTAVGVAGGPPLSAARLAGGTTERLVYQGGTGIFISAIT